MEEKELKETMDKLNEHLMQEMNRATDPEAPDLARVVELNGGFVSMANLERVLGVKG